MCWIKIIIDKIFNFSKKDISNKQTIGKNSSNNIQQSINVSINEQK